MFGSHKKPHYLVWNILSHPLSGGIRRLIPVVASTPLAMNLTLCLCSAEANGWVLLFWWSLSFKFLGDFLVGDLRLFHWGLQFAGYGFGMLSNCFFYRNALKDCFPFGFFALDGLVMREMLQIFWVDIGCCVLRFRRTVELL